MYRYSNFPSAILRYIIYPSAPLTVFHESFTKFAPMISVLKLVTAVKSILLYVSLIFNFAISSEFAFTFTFIPYKNINITSIEQITFFKILMIIHLIFISKFLNRQ